MDAKQLINKCEQWSKEDRNNHRAAVILSDAKTQQYYIHYAGDGRDMAHLVTALMSEDEEYAHDIFAAALVYAKKHIAPEEIKKLTMVAEAIAEVRREQNKSK